MKRAITALFLFYSINGFCQNDSLSARLSKNKAALDSLQKMIDILKLRDDSLYNVILNGSFNPEISSSTVYDYNQLLSEYKHFREKYHRLIKAKKLPNKLPIINIQNESIIGFGDRLHPIYGKFKRHEGIDIPAKKGTDIMSTIDGKVVLTKNSFGRYGNQVIIQNSDSVKIIFHHMGDIVVKEGDLIKCGQVIGHVGNSGLSITDHLHYEMQIMDMKVDPIFSVFKKFSKLELEHIYRINIQSLD